MFGKIASFELRYQLRNPVFWVVAVIFFLLTYGSIAIDQIQIGSGGNIHKNAPVAIARVHLILSIFFMFVTTAFVANVIVRDEESGFGPMVRSTRVTKFSYLFARFLGAFLAAAVAFLFVPIAIWLGSLMPWIDPETLGPNVLSHYLYAYFLLALPNVFLTAAIFFAVATMTRSMMYSYVGVVVFLVAYFVFTGIVSSKPELRDFAGYAEPFGLAAISNVVRYWTASESNAVLPGLTSQLLWNRLIWIGVGLAALAFAYFRFSFTERGVSKRKLRKQQRRDAKLAKVTPHVVDSLPDLRPAAAKWTRLWTRCKFEMALVFKSPAFFVLMLVGLANSIGGLLYANEIYGTPSHPLTFELIQVLMGTFGIIPLIIAIYYAGEVVWRDRDRKMHEIIDATSLPNWAYMLPKSLAVSGVLFATLVISVIAAVLVQLGRGHGQLELGQYFAWYLLPMTADMVILAVLAVFVQALSPNKYIGWGIMVIYIVATITLSNVGFQHPLYLYGAVGDMQLSDMNGDQIGGPVSWWLRLYWGGFALILAVLAHLLWRRGTETRLLPRLRRMPPRLAGMPGVFLAVGVLVAGASGVFLYDQMNIRSTYMTTEEQEEQLAEYEKRFLKYETLKQPSLTDVTLDVEIYPHERRMEVNGSYAFVNDTGAPLEVLHVRLLDRDTTLEEVNVSGAELESEDPDFKYLIYRFTTPLAPDATGTLTFRSTRGQQALRASGDDTRLVANGTFLNNGEFAPEIGMSRDGLLTDPTTRRKYDLPSELRMAKLEDQSARERNYVGNADWVNADITVTTSADQVPIAPGSKLSDVTEGGRRTAHFKSSAPILAFFSVQSAAYAVEQREADGVELSVFYDPKHSYNVERMLDAMEMSLDYYREAFGPYQFDYARIIEFPGYASFAQAFAGTVPYSERIGFIADATDPEAIDYVTYVTAHELGHQYWAHQLISADMQGGTILVETMAQYSALMVMKHQFGEDKIRRFLQYELDSYLRSRGSERIEELPLNRVENQGYIHYRKGAVVMYLLQDRLGEERVNAMLSDLLDRYRFKSQPYATSTDLVDGFLGLARNDAERELVRDLLERITIYDMKADTAETRQLADGSWETTLTIEAAKFHADGDGKETAAKLDDVIDVGLFTERPGRGAFDKADVLFMERRPITDGTQEIVLVTQTKPAFAGIDPYNKYIDRNSDDNLVDVTTAG